MADAIISRRGGGKTKLKSIRISTPPVKTDYIDGDTFDAAGMSVVANIGGVEVPVFDYTYNPKTVTGGTSAITISYTLDGVTKTTTQAITVTTISGTLGNNTWDLIAKVSAAGKASSVWKVGDKKDITINGATYSAQIIGFNHDALASSDAGYNKSTYNGGKNKAGITFRLTTAYGGTTYQMHTAAQYPGWGSCSARSSLMATIKNGMPSEVIAALRKVSKKYFTTASSNSNATDQVFVLGMAEYNLSGHTTDGTAYSFFAAGNSPKTGANQWTRTMFCDSSSQKWTDKINESGAAYYALPTQYYQILPAFCI